MKDDAETADGLSALMAEIGRNAKAAAETLAHAPADQKAEALDAAASAIRTAEAQILAANAEDMASARSNGVAGAMLDRLELTPARIASMADGVAAIAAQADPVGAVIASWAQPNGLEISRVRTPIGVIGVIYESRPNVTADAGALCLKAGNAAILRGGSESARSAAAIHGALRAGLVAADLPEASIQLVPTQDRRAVGAMLEDMADSIDVIVPRGGRSLVERVQTTARVPVFAHLDGICHVYLDAAADLDRAIAVTVNAKMRRTGICGAAECLLVDRAAADRLLPPVAAALQDAGCALRGDEASQALAPGVAPAAPEDYGREFLDAIMAVRVVDGVDGAMAHIRAHGSGHTEAVITEDAAVANRFMTELDSAILIWNASTQFADGAEFGMGAEIGIATGKLHARGPVGAEQLTSMKYRVVGQGTIRP